MYSLVDGKADDAELLTNTLNICAGHREEILSHNEYKTLSNLTTKICRQFSLIQTQKVELKHTIMPIKGNNEQITEIYLL